MEILAIPVIFGMVLLGYIGGNLIYTELINPHRHDWEYSRKPIITKLDDGAEVTAHVYWQEKSCTTCGKSKLVKIGTVNV